MNKRNIALLSKFDDYDEPPKSLCVEVLSDVLYGDGPALAWCGKLCRMTPGPAVRQLCEIIAEADVSAEVFVRCCESFDDLNCALSSLVLVCRKFITYGELYDMLLMPTAGDRHREFIRLCMRTYHRQPKVTVVTAGSPEELKQKLGDMGVEL